IHGAEHISSLSVRSNHRTCQAPNKSLQFVKRDMKPVGYIALRSSFTPELAKNFVPDTGRLPLNSAGFARSEPTSPKLNAGRLVLPFAEKVERAKPMCHGHCRHAPALLGLDYYVYGNEPRHPCAQVVLG